MRRELSEGSPHAARKSCRQDLNLERGGRRMIPLTMAKPGETVTIRRITGKDEVRQHLAELGFVLDTEVTVVSGIAGSLIVQVKDSRIALDESMASRIMF